jgi:hypothetical protein
MVKGTTVYLENYIRIINFNPYPNKDKEKIFRASRKISFYVQKWYANKIACVRTY